jgi:flagellar biosynthesis protein FlhF
LVLQSLKGIKGSLYEGLNVNAAELVKKLELMSVDEANLSSLVSHLRSLPAQTENQSNFAEQVFGDYYKAAAIKWMLNRIKIAPDFKSIADSMGVHVFIGATGGGKSSIVTKIAANYRLKEKMKVVICSCDGTRLAAHEQMRIYAKVIDTIFVPIEGVADIERVVNEHDDAQFIFIDTAGRSPKRNKLEDLMSFKNLNVPLDFHLVLSATDKEQQMDRTIRSFLSLGLSSLVFTKLDETWSYGEIFNLSQKWSVPLSYFGTGQGVPEDIERASKERVIERIFGL